MSENSYVQDSEYNNTVFDGLFERTKNDPEEWRRTAWSLRTAAAVLLEAYSENWDPDGEPVHSENEHLDSPASMLYGCAIENMIKGYLNLITKHGGFEQARNATRVAWDRHQISRLAEATGLPLTPEQTLLLRSLEAFIVWAGRYPISMKREQYTMPEQYQSGDHLTPNQIRSDGIAILEPFYKQLEDEIFADLRKCFGKLNVGKLS